MGNSRLEQRVTQAAQATLAEQGYVSAVDVLLRLGWLAPPHLNLWRQGRVECLERMVQAGLGKQSTAMRTLHTWATRRRLTPSETAYLARTRDRRQLRFSVSGKPDIELAYRTHWVSPDLSAGIVCFDVEGLKPEEVVKKLAAKKIIASDTPYKPSYARLTPSLLNTPEEVDKVVAEIAAL